jgi:ribose transport system ATP-binding protein
MISPLLEVREIRKLFSGVPALDGVSAKLGRGEVLAVVGENGAGKSTLMKIMSGVYIRDSGTMLLEGKEVHFRTVAEALRAGICLIHQELNLAENLSVVANLFLGREHTGPLGWLKRDTMNRQGVALMDRVGLPAKLAQVTVDQLAPGQKQLVEIARALAMDAKVIIMDEPTSSLTQGETDRLYEVIDDLKRAGVGIIYISHRLGEVKRVADRVTVLRDGKNAGELDQSAINHDNLVRLMVGRDLKQLYPRRHSATASHASLEIRNLRFEGGPAQPISLSIGAGEVVGMAGLVGAGRTELAEAVFGIRRIVSGELLLNGQPVEVRGPGDAIAAGILLVPEDRRLNGLVLEESVGFNLSLPNLDRLSFLQMVKRSSEKEMGQRWIDQLRIKTAGLKQTVGVLSGGNQQKVVLGKWLARGPKILILDEPTRGVDVGARSEIYAIIDQLAGSGVGIWMISSDMEEVLGMSDRIVVLHEGQLTGQLQRSEFSEEAVMRHATGAALTGENHHS